MRTLALLFFSVFALVHSHKLHAQENHFTDVASYINTDMWMGCDKVLSKTITIGDKAEVKEVNILEAAEELKFLSEYLPKDISALESYDVRAEGDLIVIKALTKRLPLQEVTLSGKGEARALSFVHVKNSFIFKERIEVVGNKCDLTLKRSKRTLWGKENNTAINFSTKN